MAAGHSHDHNHSHDHDIDVAPEVRRLLLMSVIAILLATVVGAVLWWPDGGVELPAGLDTGGVRVDATVTDVQPGDCPGGVFFGDDFFEGEAPGDVPPLECELVVLELTSGPNAGEMTSIESYLQPGTPRFETGDGLVLTEYEVAGEGLAHTFADFQRDRPLLILVALFIAAVVALGRFQGVRALGGLVVSAFVLFGYVFPALLDGKPPLAVALVASSVIAFAALYLAHGISATTTVALIGTMAALALTGILAALFTAAAQITGAASEDQLFLLVSAEGIDLRGLVLAGVVLGSLGVLDDVTVTQVSAVARLREANPAYGVGDLYRTGVRIGRDHIASTVNTLVLAYAGAALPLLLFYSNVGIPLSEAVTSEIIAVEVIRTLVGSIGLVAAVPITTALAAVVVTGTNVPRRRGRTGSPDTRGSAGNDASTAKAAPATTSPPLDDDRWDDFTPTAEDF